MTQRWIYLASVTDLDDLAIPSERVHYEWPPPGIEIHYSPPGSGQDEVLLDRGGQTSNATRFYGLGQLDDPPGNRWYVTTLGDMLLDIVFPESAILSKTLRLFDRTVGDLVSGLLAWPVIYKENEGGFMRWIKSTVKGTLGGVEEFQFSVNWGNPGDDPDPSPAELQVIGSTLAVAFAGSVDGNDAGLGGASRLNCFSSDVVFTELGVALLTQTEANNVEGGGGNLSQDGETEWTLLNSVTGLVGESAADSLPYEVATCVTLNTAHRGPRGRGRVYLPPPSVDAMEPGGKYIAGQALAAAHIISAWFTAVQVQAIGIAPVIVSRRGIILNEIIEVTVGIIPDSQRRRRWSQLEAKQVAWTFSP